MRTFLAAASLCALTALPLQAECASHEKQDNLTKKCIEIQKVDPLSKSIADYVVERGGEVVRELSDGRRLTVAFLNDVGYDTIHPAKYSSLEITLRPARPDQYGFISVEWGLTGRARLFRVLTGSEHGPDVLLAFDNVLSELDYKTERSIELKHRELREQVYQEFYGSE